MATRSPISTISYNSKAFLKEKLDLWVSSHLIQAYQFICHKGEDGDKDHIHLRIEPNKILDPMNLSESLREYPFGCEKPLGVRPWRPSKEEDWFLYAVHDKQYLSWKYSGGDRGEKLPYSWEDIVCSADYDCEVAFIRAKQSLEHTSANLVGRIRSGVKPFELVSQGENVFTINAIVRTLSQTDYQRLLGDFYELKKRCDDMMSAVESAGFSFYEDDDGDLVLVRASKS